MGELWFCGFWIFYQRARTHIVAASHIATHSAIFAVTSIKTAKWTMHTELSIYLHILAYTPSPRTENNTHTHAHKVPMTLLNCCLIFCSPLFASVGENFLLKYLEFSEKSGWNGWSSQNDWEWEKDYKWRMEKFLVRTLGVHLFVFWGICLAKFDAVIR